MLTRPLLYRAEEALVLSTADESVPDARPGGQGYRRSQKGPDQGGAWCDAVGVPGEPGAYESQASPPYTEQVRWEPTIASAAAYISLGHIRICCHLESRPPASHRQSFGAQQGTRRLARYGCMPSLLLSEERNCGLRLFSRAPQVSEMTVRSSSSEILRNPQTISRHSSCSPQDFSRKTF